MQPSFVYETIDALDLPPRGAGEMAGNLQQCYETLIEKIMGRRRPAAATRGMAGRSTDDRSEQRCDWLVIPPERFSSSCKD